MLTSEMLEYVAAYINERDPIATKLTKRFPFRRLADHSYRCFRWAQRIAIEEGGDLVVCEISALFHDIGKCVDNTLEGHARAGAIICRDYLESKGFDTEKTAQITGIIENHIHHSSAASLEAKIESDADLLDEVGALTVLWDSMGAGAQDEQSFAITYRRIKGSYEDLAKRDGSEFHTATAKRIFAERIVFLREFVENLANELGMDA